MSGRRVTFTGEAMAAVAEGVVAVRNYIGSPPVVVGGLAVLCRLSSPHRATVDLDVVDRRRNEVRHLEVLRAAPGAVTVDPAAVLLPTRFGAVKIDVLEVRQVEIDEPSDDPGDRLHATAHAWAHDTATDMAIEVVGIEGPPVEVTTPVAEPGPLVAMKLQAIENRSVDKQGTDLLDIVRLVVDPGCREAALLQLAWVEAPVARDVALHVDRWFVRERRHVLRRIREVGGHDVTTDDLDLVAELLIAASSRTT